MTDIQKTCLHIFVGKSDGVHCTRCGLHLTAQQYHELLHPPESLKNTSSDAYDKEPAKAEKAAQAAAEPPQKKPQQAAKKKEATAGE